MDLFLFLLFFLWCIGGFISFLIISEESNADGFKFKKPLFKLYLVSPLFGPVAVICSIFHFFIGLFCAFLDSNLFEKLIDWIRK